MTRLSPEREAEAAIRAYLPADFRAGHFDHSACSCAAHDALDALLAELEAVRGERDAATKVAEAAERWMNADADEDRAFEEYDALDPDDAEADERMRDRLKVTSRAITDAEHDMRSALAAYAAARSVPVSPNEGATT